MTKASYLDAYVRFLAFADTWRYRTVGMPEDEAREIYEEMLPQFESHMLEIGWTYKEFREYEPTPEEKDLTYQLRETTSFDAVAFFNATGDKN